ncbi:MAG: DsbA family oxidoreductase [Alphaproteobacteria bacterium]|jgi:predicted DsbA family dithiol-disulfide isomerase|nr:DsbA family oxidoreductase [Alphaproteobacteria bacterium]
MSSSIAPRIDVISDAICPWCYIGKRQLERALALLAEKGLRFDVAWHPFQLNPDMPAEGWDRKEYRIQKFGSWEKSQAMDARITETAAGIGLEFHLDRLTRTPNTVNAHRAIWLAGQHGVQDAVLEALFKLYFVEGGDLGDVALLTETAVAAGLDRDALVAMYEGDEGRDVVLRGDAAARQGGISGVPSFLMGGYLLFSGALPAEQMAEAFAQAWQVLSTRAA